MALQGVTASRTTAAGVTTPMPQYAPPAASGGLFYDSAFNYYELVNGRPVNIGQARLAELQAAGAVPQSLTEAQGTQYRVQTGLAQPTSGQNSAQAELKSVLDDWGLGSLAGWAWDQIISGTSQAEIVSSLRDQQAYKDRFSGNQQRKAAGLQPLSESEYLAWEKQAASMMKAEGLPAGFYDSPADFAGMIGRDTSLSELTKRVQWAKQLAVTDPSVLPEEVQTFRTMYGVKDGDLAAYMLDPTKATPLLERQIRGAATATRARLAGFDPLTATQAERVGALTGSVEQAAQGFQQLAHMRELMSPLPGMAGEAQITTDTQLAAQFAGDQQAQAQISRRQRARTAAFEAAQGDYKQGAGSSTKAAL